MTGVQTCALPICLYAPGVVVFFVLLGFFGLIVHCSSFNDNQDPCLAGCRNCCYGWGILDCLPASLEACFALVVVFIVVFAILGIAYGFLAATMAVQRIWQRHYHIITKRELTMARTPSNQCLTPLYRSNQKDTSQKTWLVQIMKSVSQFCSTHAGIRSGRSARQLHGAEA